MRILMDAACDLTVQHGSLGDDDMVIIANSQDCVTTSGEGILNRPEIAGGRNS